LIGKLSYHAGSFGLKSGFEAIHEAILNVVTPACILEANGSPGVSVSGTIAFGEEIPKHEGDIRLIAFVPPLHPRNLGSQIFKKRHGIRYAYVVGDMAQGISSYELVRSAGNAGLLGFFGSAGLKPKELEKTLFHFQSQAGGIPFGVNLIHSIGSPHREYQAIDLFLKYSVRTISAAGYLKITAPLVYYRLKGIHQASDGGIVCPNRIMAKVSRMELAAQFLSPPPEKFIHQLVEQKLITEFEAGLAKYIPLADDLTAEADSAGHTDNRPAISLLPSMIKLKDKLSQRHEYTSPPCIGLAGGIGTPGAVAAAFAMGADYVLTGSINQACIESGTSNAVRQLLSNATQTDVAMAPAADMFERGIRVQVLKHGTMFAQRASKLYDLYRQYESFDQIPESQQKEIQEKILQNTFEREWEQTRKFFNEYDPDHIKRAEDDPRFKMALIFRSYLGKSSRWAIQEEPTRKSDYQIWCGPSMGAFNDWAKGSFLEIPENRTVVTLAMNLLYGACVGMRRQAIVNAGVSLPPGVGRYRPLEILEIEKILNKY
jgi:trans-AT polyketide synthase, acyltransferase and oxidoreductase domains